MEIIRMIAVTGGKQGKVFQTESGNFCFFNNQGKLIPDRIDALILNGANKKKEMGVELLKKEIPLYE